VATKKNPADAAVAFFETAPIDVAVQVLAICKGIVQRRSPKVKSPRASTRTAATSAQDVATR
jgi:hypothetical protein